MQTSNQPNPLRWRILAAVGVGTIMSPLDSSVVNIALPTITDIFNTTLPISEWVAMAYLLTISSLLLTYGRLGDLYGHRNIYLAGFVSFTAASVLCSFAGSIGALIAFRVIQALGAGMMMASGPAIITAAFPTNERGRALGINGMMVSVGLAIGPALGGLLVRLFGWRSIFLINLPIGIAGTWWAAKVLPGPGDTQFRRRFDVRGALALFTALFGLLLALSRGEAWGWRSALVTASWVTGLLALAFFIRTELKVPDPMVDLRLFRSRLFTAANLSALLNFMAQFSVTLLMPFYLQQTLGLPPHRAGLIMLAFPALTLVLAPMAGSLSDRFGSQVLSPLGMAIVTLALLVLSGLDTDSRPMDVVWRLALMGMGSGLFQAPNNSAIMGSVPRNRLGLASGMLATMRNIGMVLGIAISGAVFAVRHAYYLGGVAAGVLTPQAAHMFAIRDSFRVGAVLALLGVVAALVRGKEAGRRSMAAPQPGA
jgi:EmrB/QacA subfamily drug resistance transporter